ncbi:MAG TPA: ABC transporter permease [Candidatus Omnitrophota bacterium]|nr:ABC transporter permease [Candidatus Omnitrophota bacterium]HPN88194.1 ABC transporter permease [Candidatus Omnitrophota bacterium]
MKKIFAIAQKELSVYFRSPIAYVVLIVTIVIFNVFFFAIIDNNEEATLRDIFKVMEFLFVFIIPILTMKVFSEEKQMGTMEFLMTTPTQNNEIVLGKYLGVLLFFSFLIILTIPYYGIIEFFSRPDRMAILTGYIGIWLEGAFFISIGLMVSSWTKSQIVAAILSYLFLFLVYFSSLADKYTNGVVKAIVKYSNVMTHSENFIVGILSSSDLIYFFSGILFCLVMTRISIDTKIWDNV